MTYLRWKRRGRRLTAAIVRSERRNGRPRQQQLACVGSLLESERLDLATRTRMWDAIDAALDRLALPADQDQRCVQVFHAVVPHPEFSQSVVTSENKGFSDL